MIDKPTVLALATAFGVPDAGIVLFQIPDASPLHTNGEWLASLGQLNFAPPIGGLGRVGPIAYGPTEDAASQALYAAIKASATQQATDAAAADQAAAAKAATVNAVVTK